MSEFYACVCHCSNGNKIVILITVQQCVSEEVVLYTFSTNIVINKHGSQRLVIIVNTITKKSKEI